jgi:hypothetical protein
MPEACLLVGRLMGQLGHSGKIVLIDLFRLPPPRTPVVPKLTDQFLLLRIDSLKFGHIYRQPRGMYLSMTRRGNDEAGGRPAMITLKPD